MFIAHHVIVIDKAFRQKLVPENGSTSLPDGLEPALAELVPRMRRLGHDSFSGYLDVRKTQLRQLITEAHGSYLSFVYQCGRVMSRCAFSMSTGYSIFWQQISQYSILIFLIITLSFKTLLTLPGGDHVHVVQ